MIRKLGDISCCTVSLCLISDVLWMDWCLSLSRFSPTHSLKFINLCVTCTSFSLPYSHIQTNLSISAPAALVCYLLFTQDWLLLWGLVISVHLLVSHLHFYVPLLYHKEWKLTHKKMSLQRTAFLTQKMVYGLLFSHYLQMASLLSNVNPYELLKLYRDQL